MLLSVRFHSGRIFLGALLLSTAVAWSQGTPNFSGLWKQDNDRCQPKRNGDVTLQIEHRDPELTVETSISRGSASSRHAIQKYTTDGKVSVSTGADGDEFDTSVVWNDSSLVFTIEEHEDGRILRSKETWTLIEDGAVLQRVREPQDKGAKQAVIYLRQQPPGLHLSSHADCSAQACERISQVPCEPGADAERASRPVAWGLSLSAAWPASAERQRNRMRHSFTKFRGALWGEKRSGLIESISGGVGSNLCSQSA